MSPNDDNELVRLRAQVAAVEALCESWETSRHRSLAQERCARALRAVLAAQPTKGDGE